jgi:hypothetical protein
MDPKYWPPDEEDVLSISFWAATVAAVAFTALAIALWFVDHSS